MDIHEQNYRIFLKRDAFGGYSKKLARIWDRDIDAAILLHHLTHKDKYWKREKRLTKDGFFYNTAEDILEETMLTRGRFERALLSLKNKGVVDTDIRKTPPKKHFKINYEILIQIISEDKKSKEKTTLANQFACLSQIEKNTEKTEDSICRHTTNSICRHTATTNIINKTNISLHPLVPKGTNKQTEGLLDLKSKQGGTRKKLIKRKINNPCSTGRPL